MISLSQELFDGILCFVEELVVAPRPKVRIEPVCPLNRGGVDGKHQHTKLCWKETQQRGLVSSVMNVNI